MSALFNILYHNIVPLLVGLPFLQGILLIFCKRAHFSINFTFFNLLINLALVILSWLTLKHYSFQPFHYVYGNFNTQLGIEHCLTLKSNILLLILSSLAILSYWWGIKLLSKQVASHNIYIYNVLYMLTYGGLCGVALSNDLFNLFICVELVALCSYGIIGFNQTSLSSPFTAFNYLLISTIGVSLYVLALGIIYMITGYLNYHLVGLYIASHSYNAAMVIALILTCVFLAIKSGLLPFSTLTTRVYKDAPFAFNPLFSSIHSKIIALAFLKIILLLFTAVESTQSGFLIMIFKGLGIFTVVACSIFAMKSSDIKTLLGWSSCSQMGFIIILVLGLRIPLLEIAMFFVIWHAITKFGLFLIAGNIYYLTYSTKLSSANSLVQRNSVLSIISFLIFGFNIIGIPGTLGFSLKWLTLKKLMENGNYTPAIALTISSFFAGMYIWRIVNSMMFKDKNSATLEIKHQKVPILMEIIPFSVAIVLMILGFISPCFFSYITNLLNSTLTII